MAVADTPLDTTIALVTPENISFEYQLAGPFRRLPAYLIDLVATWVIIISSIVIIGIIIAYLNLQSFGSFVTAGLFLLIFVMTWFYGAVLETVFNGRTIGKWITGIRTIGQDGRPIDGQRAFLRNLLKVADLGPIAALSQWDENIPPVFLIPTGMVALTSMISTRRMQRLGDLAAGTIVIVDERSWRMATPKLDDPRIPALASYLPANYRVSRSMARTLAIYAERRHYLTPARRREVTRHLTTHLIDRFEFRRDIDPDLLMQSLYYKTFWADSKKEPMDLGKLAGYSPLRKDMPQTPVTGNGDAA
jgi:uncharacterized RDD family membrane protein YckC